MLLGLLKKAAPVAEIRPLALADGRDVDVRWVRDARARRLRLIVSEKGARLTLPRSVSVRAAEAFLHEHRDWLSAQLAREGTQTRAPLTRGGEHLLPLRGQDLPLLWREGRYARAALTDEGVVLQLPDRAGDAQLHAALRDFYTQQARQDLGRWLPRYLPGLPRAPRNVRFRPLSSLWGSLSPSDAVSLDLSLVLGRPSAFEYVLVHELCHLIHADHSRRFWREVEARWPGWREERDYLRGEGLSLKARLARFIG
ncbi:SprT family zinc-dependent metalloprotease [Arenimonas sp. MALMAid1274]|uniref:YgjP family zinc-dependent metalloprotease n=1 Tax=Arenimonas sp. MALMAid1274 TaxID=3411630 RepID=UPI003BA33AA8